jgi:hypothetical protein
MVGGTYPDTTTKGRGTDVAKCPGCLLLLWLGVKDLRDMNHVAAAEQELLEVGAAFQQIAG